MKSTMPEVLGGIALTLLFAGIAFAADETQQPVMFSGGHDTDRRDHGRPVVLIAGALGVTPELFRQAFSGVTPAKGGRPSPADARRNKEALMKVLKPHGITNDRLDQVSDYYRYRPQDGELWPTTAAKAYAVIEGGQVRQIVVTDPGSGYSSAPVATVQGVKGATLKVSLQYGTDLKKNGCVKSIDVTHPK